MSHTPGPWSLDDSNSIHRVGADPEYTLLAAVRFQGGDNAEGIANARLMAAAPDMLEALKDVWDAGVFECCCGAPGGACDGTCTHTRVKLAIAKAEGKT